MSNPVIKKIVYCIKVALASPLCISKGEGTLTDNDVLLNGEGVPFVPGSSLTGAMRGYIEKDKQQECIFGYEDMKQKKGRMSSLFVSDLFFDSKVETAVRDGVKLSDNKTAVSQEKFDMEVVDTGVTGHFYMELWVREQDKEEDLMSQLAQVFLGWREKEIRLGSKKTRGYGEIRLLCVKQKTYDSSNILEYMDAYCAPENQDATWADVDLQKLKSEESKYITLTLPLKLEGGISIRQYIARKGEPDFEHITANGEPVIPGSSFNGALRHRLKEILQQLGAINSKEILDNIFGYVIPSSDSEARVSHVIVDECILEGSKRLIMVRNAVSRFEGGSKDGALYREAAFVGGTTELVLKVKKTEDAEATIGLLLLVLKDVQNGFLAVGGQTAIGRGLFAANGALHISSELPMEKYEKAAFAVIRRA